MLTIYNIYITTIFNLFISKIHLGLLQVWETLSRLQVWKTSLFCGLDFSSMFRRGCQTNWLYSVTQLPVEFQWHWHVSNAKIPIIWTTNIHILMNLMIKMINLIGVIPYMTVMTDISALDTCQCHWNSTGNWVTELVYCDSQCEGQKPKWRCLLS